MTSSTFQAGEAVQENSVLIIHVRCLLKQPLHLSNRYGNTDIDELHGFVNLILNMEILLPESSQEEMLNLSARLILAYGKGIN